MKATTTLMMTAAAAKVNENFGINLPEIVLVGAD